MEMGEVGNMDLLMVPDSYQSEEEKESYLNSKSPPRLFRSLITKNTNTNNNDDDDNVITINNTTSEPKTTICSEDDDENNNNIEEDKEEKNNIEEDEQKFYKVWFDAFLAKHGIDIDHLDQSSLQQLEKTWLNKQLVAAEMRSKEAEVDLKFINFRSAICKQWLSSL